MTLEIFTIAYNAMPFIARHLKVFEQLRIPWKWHIREGPADYIKDSYRNGGRIIFGRDDGGSYDGTAEYLDSIAGHPNVDLARRRLWNGKTEQVNHAVASIAETCVLLEVDCDEMWTVQQLHDLVAMFVRNPQRAAAWFYCRYFVGPKLMISGIDCLGNHTAYEWIRAWRWTPGCAFARHEPPVVCTPIVRDIAKPPCESFSHKDTEAAGLVFNHYSWCTEEQVRFKESYYGYTGTLNGWRRLQSAPLPVQINHYIPHLGHGIVVEAPEEHHFQ